MSPGAGPASAPPEVPEAPRGRRLQLRDLAGLVVGYALAAGLVGAFWPATGLPESPAVVVVLGLLYGWLGLAMSGPVVLLLDARARPRAYGRERLRRARDPSPPPGADPIPREAPPEARLTRAELAWLAIGGYWIGMAVFVLPASRGRAPFSLLGILQLFAGLALLLALPARAAPTTRPPGWTHRAAVALLCTWPLAWAALILLGKTLF